MSLASKPDAKEPFESFIELNLGKELMRFTTAGSVDDGKSTLIGRLLHDSKSVFEDQMAAVKKSRINRSTGAVDFSLLTDGLRAEREQGITIDVAYRYFETPRRKFIIADTPGHEQYTRNMATGASTANLAVILIDATKGVLAQTRRHTYIASLLGIPNVLVAINKMDLVEYREEVFLKLQKDFDALAKQLAVPHVVTIPISALAGDNVVARSAHMPWYHGPTFLEHLETVPLRLETMSEAVRFPVQYVIRPDASFRGFAGQVTSGVIRPGDTVVSLPSERKSRVKTIATFDGDAPEAFPPMSVTLTLEDEIDLSRGDMLVSPGHPPRVSRHFEAMVVWFNAEPAEPGKSYLLKHTSRTVRAKALKIRYRVNVNTLVQEPVNRLHMNDIAYVEFETVSPLFFDPYTQNRITGSFIMIDPISNATLGAGMIRADLSDQTVGQVGAPISVDVMEDAIGSGSEDRHRQAIFSKYSDSFFQVDRLYDFIQQGMLNFVKPNPMAYEQVQILALAKASKSFDAVRRLCEIAYCEDAGVVLRSLLNLCAIVRWIAIDPEKRSAKYLGWFWIQMKRDSEEQKDTVSPDQLAEIDRHYAAVRKLFEFVDVNGKVKMVKKWHQPEAKSIEDLFKQTGLAEHYGEYYRPLSGVEHSDAMAFFPMIIGMERGEGLKLHADLLVPHYLSLAFRYFADIFQISNKVLGITTDADFERIAREGMEFFRRQLGQ